MGRNYKDWAEIEKLESKNNTESMRGDFKAGLHSTLSMCIYIYPGRKLLKTQNVPTGNSLRLSNLLKLNRTVEETDQLRCLQKSLQPVAIPPGHSESSRVPVYTGYHP